MRHGELFGLFMNNPREKWIELAKPHLEMIAKYSCRIIGDTGFEDNEYPFSLEVLAPDYSFELEPGDVVKVVGYNRTGINIGYLDVPSDNRWMVIRKQPAECS